MKNNKTRKLIGGGIKYKTRSIPLKFLKEGNQQQPTNSINFNSNSIDTNDLGKQLLVIIKKIQKDLNSSNNNNNNIITFSIVGKKEIK